MSPRRVGDLSRTLLRGVAAPAFAIAVAVIVGAGLVGLLGRNPLEVYGILFAGGLSGWPNIAVTLQMMSPLLFTGLSVAIAFRAGLVEHRRGRSDADGRSRRRRGRGLSCMGCRPSSTCRFACSLRSWAG